MNQKVLAEVLELQSDYVLTVVIKTSHGCPCAKYLRERWDVLRPEIIQQARNQRIEPSTLFARFTDRLHNKICTK